MKAGTIYIIGAIIALIIMFFVLTSIFSPFQQVRAEDCSQCIFFGNITGNYTGSTSYTIIDEPVTNLYLQGRVYDMLFTGGNDTHNFTFRAYDNNITGYFSGYLDGQQNSDTMMFVGNISGSFNGTTTGRRFYVLPGDWLPFLVVYLILFVAIIGIGWFLFGEDWFPKEEKKLSLEDYDRIAQNWLYREEGIQVGQFFDDKKHGMFTQKETVKFWYPIVSPSHLVGGSVYIELFKDGRIKEFQSKPSPAEYGKEFKDEKAYITYPEGWRRFYLPRKMVEKMMKSEKRREEESPKEEEEK